MPEIFRREKNGGFIIIWQIKEPVEFFQHTVAPDTITLFKHQFDTPSRIREKLIPHYVLNGFNHLIKLDNTQRKPVTNEGYVSISHCKNFVATAFYPDSPVGVDIEYYGDRILKIRHKFLDENEKRFCGDDSEKCLILWAAKEALFKKYGGSSVFFAENIHVQEPVKTKQQELTAEVFLDGVCIKENLHCELLEEFVLVHTL